MSDTNDKSVQLEAVEDSEADRQSEVTEPRVGCVVIGRNEGERLERCLRSLVGQAAAIVYVDSGSTDQSVEMAQALGCEVVNLDLDKPFTAARARNAGLCRLQECAPELTWVQFVDGDCEVVEDWLSLARGRLEERNVLAIVCGRRRERYPDASIYNRLCDVEWDTPIGDALACGGDAMMRIDVLHTLGGFDSTLIAGEEPELCVRVRRAGWKVERVDAEMTLHDANMTHFAQWWKRAVRAGHAYAEGASLHGDSPERHWVQERRRILFWGGVLPALAVGATPLTLGASLGLLAGYPISAARVFRHAKQAGRPNKDALPYAFFTTLGKLPEMRGLMEFHVNRALGQKRGLIEYK